MIIAHLKNSKVFNACSLIQIHSLANLQISLEFIQKNKITKFKNTHPHTLF